MLDKLNLVIGTAPRLRHWLKQRYWLIVAFTFFMLLDVVVTYLYVFVFETAQEQNPLFRPVLELPYGIWILTLLKVLWVAVVCCISYYAYSKLHDARISDKARKQSITIEKWLWLLQIGIMAVLDALLLISVN
jgi:heme/copper-type cytochrome/quinol oxidase subunit 2